MIARSSDRLAAPGKGGSSANASEAAYGTFAGHEDKTPARTLEAALCVRDAIEGRVHVRPRSTEAARKAHVVHLYIPLSVALLLLVLVSFVEQPTWSLSVANFTSSPAVRAHYLLFGIPILPRWSTILAESLCLAVIALDVTLQLVAHGPAQHFASRLHVAFAACLALAVVDDFVGALTAANSFRIAAYLRITLLVLHSRPMLVQFNLVRTTANALLGVAFTAALFMFLATWAALLLFSDGSSAGLPPANASSGATDTSTSVAFAAADSARFATATSQSEIFTSWPETAWQLLVMLSANAFPDIMLPAYATARVSVLFFAAVLILGNWFLLNLILAIVNKAHLSGQAAERRALAAFRADRLERAFDLIDEDASGDISRAEAEAVFEELALYEALPAEKRQALFDSMAAHVHVDGEAGAAGAPRGHRAVSRQQFQALCTRLSQTYKSERPHAKPLVEALAPEFAASACWQATGAVVRSPYFEMAVDTLLVVNAVALLVDGLLPHVDDTSATDGAASFDASFSSLYDLSMLGVFTLEMLVKLAVLGAARYVSSLKNAFDGLCTIASLAMTLLVYLPNGIDDPAYLRYALMLRLLRLLRLFFNLPPVAFIGATFVKMLPPAAVLFQLLLSVMYVFAALGMQLFGGLVNTDPSRPQYALLQRSDFGRAGYYCASNFNDLMSGMVLCFELLVVSNWNTIASGFVAVTSGWARYFFIAFWLLAVLVFFNLLVAFAIGAYNAAAEEESEPSALSVGPDEPAEPAPGTPALEAEVARLESELQRKREQLAKNKKRRSGAAAALARAEDGMRV